MNVGLYMKIVLFCGHKVKSRQGWTIIETCKTNYHEKHYLLATYTPVFAGCVSE